MRQLTLLGSLGSLAVGLVVFLVSVAGIFWPATSPTDPGMLSTVAVFVLIGVVGLMLERVRQRRREAHAATQGP